MTTEAEPYPPWPDPSGDPNFPRRAWLQRRCRGAGCSGADAHALEVSLDAFWGSPAEADRLRHLSAMAAHAPTAAATVMLRALGRPAPEAEFLLLWELPAAYQGGPVPPGGDVLAPLYALLLDLGRLALAPVHAESAWPANDRVLALLRADPTLRDPVDLAVAGRLEGAPRCLELRTLLSDAPARATLEAWWADTVGSARAQLGDDAEGQSALDALVRGFDFCCAALRFGALIGACLPSPEWRPDRVPVALLRGALDRAIAWVDTDPTHARSWEHQRWGLAGDPQPLIGRDYIQAVILQQLAQIGVPTARPRLRAILERLPAAPLRYYGDWDRLPPDCDSLGLFLTLATQLGGVAPAKVAAWLSVLRPSLREDGHIPTWLTQGLDGPTTPEPRWSWGGDDCIASATMCVLGLISWDRAAWADVIAVNLARIRDAHARDTGDGGSFYYGRPWADLILAQVHDALQRGAPEDESPLQTAGPVRARVDAALRQQGADGGWGGPQATALTLQLVCGRGASRLAVLRALRYLSERQRPDGSWRPEPLFWTLGKAPLPTHPHEGPELTTSLCAAGLHAGLEFLERA